MSTAALETFRVLAASVSLMMILSPIPSMFRIVRAGVVGHYSIVPLVSMLANCHINLLYGYMVRNIFPMFATFLFGDVISLVYIALFYRYTIDRRQARLTIACFVGPLAVVTIYAIGGSIWFGQTQEQIGRVIGYISIISTVLLYSSPFEKVALVLKHRSAVFLNFHMVLMGTIANLVWVTYTAMEPDWIYFGTSAFTAIAGMMQIVLYVLFNPQTHPLHEDNECELPVKCDDPGMEIMTEFNKMASTPQPVLLRID